MVAGWRATAALVKRFEAGQARAIPCGGRVFPFFRCAALVEGAISTKVGAAQGLPGKADHGYQGE
ncbi:hypothetical protein DB459_03190 [Bradyrhizobium sp. WD16]|nr:hypothetical protein DB459_03190 [Bradyrhizobium sp. WD16]